MPRPTKRIGWTGGAVLAAIAALAFAIAWWWRHPPDPAATLRARYAPLARVDRRAAPDLGTGVERWRIVDARGDTASAVWRPAPAGTTRPWTVVMLGGLQTGDRAALLLPADARANALSVDWPWRERRNLGPREIVVRLPAIQAAVLRSPARLTLGIEAAARQPGVDSSRIALLGASLGVPPAAAAMLLTRRPAALVLLHGSADLQALLRAELERALRPRWLATPLAALAYRLIRPLEPSLHGRAAAGVPTLIVNAERDERLPRAGVLRLHRAYPGASIRWQQGVHMRPRRAETIAALAAQVAAWLDSLPAANAAGRPPR